MKKHIPNFITLLNLFCGSIAVLFVVKDAISLAFIFVLAGIFFDFMDGFVARILKVRSNLGLQLDSLADMVTSGLVPGLVMFQLFNRVVAGDDGLSFLPYFGLLITLSSAYRLANFNLDDSQTNSFIGIPTPANTLFILSIPMILEHQSNFGFNGIILNIPVLIFVTLLSSYWLNAPLKLMALKFTSSSLRTNKWCYILIVISIVLILVLQFIGIILSFFCYLILSQIKSYKI